ncbi:hypothetical protein LINPERPRIM_LOCUS25097 [Linum perenne]
MDSLLEHDEDWHQNVFTSLAPSELLELTTLTADFPDVALQEFWTTFELDEHKKVISFYLGGVYKDFTYDEFAAHLGIPREHYEGHHLGWENNPGNGEEYDALWSHITGVPGAHTTSHNSVKSLSHPLYRFIHMVWHRSLLIAPEKDCHHISREELLLLRAIWEAYPLHPGLVLARLFHQKTQKPRPPRSLLGGNFVGRLIISLGLSQSYGPDVPRRIVHTI